MPVRVVLFDRDGTQPTGVTTPSDLAGGEEVVATLAELVDHVRR